MLTISGKCLDVTSETKDGPTGSFVSTTISLLVGSGSSVRVERLRAGRDLPTADLPKVDEHPTFEVVASAYPTRGGAAVQLTALRRVQGARVAAVS